jgi:hypothetical protein
MNKITYEQQHLDRILGMQAKYSLLCLQNEFQKDLQEMMNAPRKRGLDQKKKCATILLAFA